MLAAVIAAIIVPALIWTFLLYQVLRFRRLSKQDSLPPITVSSALARISAFASNYTRTRASQIEANIGEEGGAAVAAERAEDERGLGVERRSIWEVLRLFSRPL